jgi:hypothetical protein
VRPGTGSIVTISGFTVTVQAHAGILDLQTATATGPYGYALGASVALTVNAAGASARTDAIWIRSDDPAESDGSSVPDAVAGYTASSSTAPARATLLATVAVPATGGGNPALTVVAPFTAAAGGRLLVRDATTQAALITSGQAYRGLPIYRLDLDMPYTYRTGGFVSDVPLRGSVSQVVTLSGLRNTAGDLIINLGGAYGTITPTQVGISQIKTTAAGSASFDLVQGSKYAGNFGVKRIDRSSGNTVADGSYPVDFDWTAWI